jgi:hypothetical protein
MHRAMASAVSIGAGVGRKTPRRPWVVLAVCAPVLFAAGQAALEWRHERLLREFITSRGLAPVPFTAGDAARNVGWSLVLFLACALAGIVLATRGYRFAWAAPAAIFIFGTAIGAGHFPETIGAAWMGPQAIAGHSIAHWYLQLWCGAVTDLVLVSLPAIPFVLANARRRPAWRPGRADALAFLVVATGVAIVLRANAILGHSSPGPVVIASVCAFAVLAGIERPWWPWAQLIVSMGVAGTLGSLLWIVFPSAGIEASTWSQVTGLLPDVVPVAVCALIASLWEPLSHALRRSGAPRA